MSYNFEIIGITPVFTFFNYQQELETSPKRSKAYLGSYYCTLDAFIKSTKTIHQKPEWNWDEVVETIVNFWLKNEDTVKQWQSELDHTKQEDNLIIARVANFATLRTELEQLL